MHRYDQRVDRRAGGAAQGAGGPVPGKQTLVDDNGVSAEAGDAVAAAGGSSGEALPGHLQRKYEGSLGADLSGVRVHRSAESQTAAQAVGAKAYTLGRDIHFGAGQYDPSSPQGEHLLAHEVAHTVQQQGGLRRLQLKDIAVSKPGDAHEVEADAAADAMVAGKPASVGGATTAVARKENPEGVSWSGQSADKAVGDDRKAGVAAADTEAAALAAEWTSLGGDALMATVRAHVAAWKLFRAAPTSGVAMPGDVSFVDAVVKFPSGKMTPGLREYASRELGPEGLSLLGEMISMQNRAFDVELIFNVKHHKVKHHYDLSVAAGKMTTMGRLSYSNDLPTPWKWGPVSMQIAGVSLAVMPLQGKKALDPGLFKIDATMASPAGEPAVYWGWKDFQGMVDVVNPPSGGIDTPVGGASVSSGAGLTFTNKLGTFAFSNMAWKASASTEIKLSTPKVKVTAMKGSYGYAAVGNECEVKTAPISTKVPLVDAVKEFHARIALFENGSAALPTSALPEIQRMMAMIRDFVQAELLEPRHAEAFKQHGIDPLDAFRPLIDVQGWASMRWVDAKTDSERDAKNLQLSDQRARSAAEGLLAVWGPWTYGALTIRGMGAGIDATAAGGVGAETASDARSQLEQLQAELIVKKKALAEAEKKKDAVEISKLQSDVDRLQTSVDNLQDLVAPTGSKKHLGNEEWIRQALIRVTWKGKVADLGAASVAPKP